MKRLRVYLSSTYEDLKLYRDAVFSALEKGGMDVARMEAYTAADERPLDLCLRDVAQSDIFVGVYAWRYGYEPPAAHGNPDGKSITELEYRRAEAAQLRKLLFFAHPDTQAGWPDGFKDVATGAGEQGKKLDSLRKELLTEKTGSFFRKPDELATLVLAAILRSGMSGRVYNVPPLPSGLVARPNLTDAIVTALVDGRDGMPGSSTLIQGAGGFGKTTLAIGVCHDPKVVEAFPDGMLWTSLGETPNLKQVLGDLHVLACGSPPVVAGVEEIGQSLANALKGRRCLVVVDDAWRTEDLAPFLRLAGPKLLVTTRIRTLIEESGQTAWPEVPVDEMQAGEAAAILGRGLALEGPTPIVLHRLADQLGYWPLLLDLANARLREEHRSGRGSAAECIDFVATLFHKKGVLGFDRRNSNARNAAVARSIEVGLERADEMFPGLARKAAELSVFPENMAIPARVLADLWGIDEFDVEEEVLRPLGNSSLLRWDREAKEIRLHMMIGRALKERLGNAEGGSAAVGRRLLDAWGDPHRLPHDYAWRWFGWYCIQAGDVARLKALLLDVGWLRAKLDATDINALVGEFDNVHGDAQVDLIQSALRLSAHVLARDRGQLAGQLLARVPEQQSGLRDRIVAGARAIRGPWLRPLRTSLTSAGGPLLRTLTGHTDEVTTIACTLDGTRLVSASKDRTLKVWDLARGDAQRTLRVDDAPVGALALSADGTRAVSASHKWIASLDPSHDKTLKVWDLEQGTVLRTLEGHTAAVLAVALTADGTRAVSASDDKTLKVWDLERGEALRTLEGHTGRVRGVALTPNGLRAVSASSDGTLKVWDLERDEALRTLEGHTAAVFAVALSPDGTRAVSASQDKTLKIWDLEQGKVLRTLEGHTAAVLAVALTADGTRAVSASEDKTLKVWDLERGKELRTLLGHVGHVRAVLTPDGTCAVSASRDKTLKVWDLECGPAPGKSEERPVPIGVVAISADGMRAVSVSRYGQTLTIWDPHRGEVLRTLEGYTRGVHAVALTADGTRAVSWSEDKTFRVWDLERGETLHTYSLGDGSYGYMTSVVISADGTRAAALKDYFEPSSLRTVDVFDFEQSPVQVGSNYLTLARPHSARVFALARTSDGTRVVLSDHAVWDIERGEDSGERHTLDAFFGDGTRAPQVGSGIRVWDLERGEELRTLHGQAGTVDVMVMVCTPDGTRAVCQSYDGTLEVWDLERGEALRTIKGHGGRLGGVTLTPNGMRAVSASSDGAVVVWDLEVGKMIARFMTDSAVATTAVACDGRTIIAGDEEGRVHLLLLEDAP